jgi:PAS domain S-box-containing protein
MREEDDDQAAMRAEIVRLRAAEAELSARAARAEDELHASRAILIAAIENLPFEFWARDQEGYCLHQNALARTNWGDLLRKRPEDMDLPAQVIETWLANNRRALAGETVRGDVEYQAPEGTRHVHNILAPIRIDDRIVGTLGVNIDLSERRRTLQALRESQDKLRLAVEAAGIGLWSWDPISDQVTWEPILSAMFGLPAGTAPGGRDGYLALVHPEDRERAASKIAAGVESGRWEDEHRIVRADGAVRWVLVKGTVTDGDEPPFVLGAVIDVTARKHRDEQLREAQKLEAVGQLTAGIAHNFNNMLMGVLSNLEVAAQRAPADLVPLLGSAADSARRAAELVRKLMTYAGRTRTQARTVEDVSALVVRALELCRNTFDRRITFEQTCQLGEAFARVDATQLEQAVLNILINARDAVESSQVRGPCITVSIDIVRAGASALGGRDGDYVRVRIGDNGVGMDAATAQRVYDPFFTTKEIGRGTGLGLTTTHAILHEHGGFISCESTQGSGTTFSLYLPAEPGPPGERQAPAPERAVGRGDETVLVVDDERALRSIVCLMLHSAGYTALQAASGTEALELLRDPEVASKVALVLLDVSMPGLPRRELRRRLNELTRARVVYFTGYALDAADADANDWVLEKPVTQEQLLWTIRHVLDRRE